MGTTQKLAPEHEDLSFVKINGRLPTQAGLSFEEALDYEAKEYRKAYYAQATSGEEDPDFVPKWQRYSQALAKNFFAIFQLYGVTPNVC